MRRKDQFDDLADSVVHGAGKCREELLNNNDAGFAYALADRMREAFGGDPEKSKADARALWAVRVLDAWAAKQPGRPTSPSPNRTEHGDWWVWVTAGGYHIGPDPDAARHAAATALYPDLPESVRRELGECP